MATHKFDLTANLNLAGPYNVPSVIASLRNQLKGIKANVQINFPTQIRGKVTGLTKDLNGLNVALAQINSSSKTLSITLHQLGAAFGSIGKSSRGIRTTVDDLDKVDLSARKVSHGIAGFGEQAGLAVRRFAAFTIAAGTIYGVARAFTAGIKDAFEFEREMVRVSQVTGKAVSDLGDLKGEITRLSTNFGVSSKELSKVAVTLAQAGLTAKDTKVSLEALAKSTLAPTFDDIANTTEGAIAAMQQFGIEAKDLEKTLGTINSVSAAFAVESEDLIAVIRRSGGAFKAAGGSLNELLALFTSVRQTTRESAETIATGFRTIFQRLQRKDTVDALGQLGIQLRDVNGEFVGPLKAIEALSTALANVPRRGRIFSEVTEQLGGFRQISKVIPLIEKFDVTIRALNVAERGQASLARDAAKAQESLLVQLTKVREEFEDLFRQIGSSATIRGLVSSFALLATSLAEVLKQATPLIPLLTTIAGIKATGAAIKFFPGVGRKLTGFAEGGPVPGQGSGDTVPALLEPGEFVLKKKAARAIGSAVLNKANKYATGGFVFPPHAGETGFSAEEDEDFYRGLSGRPLRKQLPRVGLSYKLDQLYSPGVRKSDQQNLISDQTPGELEKTRQHLKSIANLRAKSKGAAVQNSRRSALFSAIDLSTENMTDTMLKIIRETVGELTVARPNNKYAGRFHPDGPNSKVEIVLDNRGVDDITRTLTHELYHGFDHHQAFSKQRGRTTFLGKPRYYGDNGEWWGSDYPEFISIYNEEMKKSDLFTNPDPRIKVGSKYKNYSHYKRVEGPTEFSTALFHGVVVGKPAGSGPPITEEDLIRELPRTYAYFQKHNVGRKKVALAPKPSKFDTTAEPYALAFAQGGCVPGQGIGDKVPAMLEPGEFVLNKKAVNAIGPSVLAKANKYARGGSVLHLQRGSKGPVGRPDLPSIPLDEDEDKRWIAEDRRAEFEFARDNRHSAGRQRLPGGTYDEKLRLLKHERDSRRRLRAERHNTIRKSYDPSVPIGVSDAMGPEGWVPTWLRPQTGPQYGPSLDFEDPDPADRANHSRALAQGVHDMPYSVAPVSGARPRINPDVNPVVLRKHREDVLAEHIGSLDGQNYAVDPLDPNNQSTSGGVSPGALRYANRQKPRLFEKYRKPRAQATAPVGPDQFSAFRGGPPAGGGNGGPPGLGGPGGPSGPGGFGRFLRGGTAAAIGVGFAAPQLIEASPLDKRTKAGASGLISGALTGGFVGSTVGGPAGAAVGAVIGGLGGLVGALESASKEIEDAKIAKGIEDFSNKLKNINTLKLDNAQTAKQVGSAASQLLAQRQAVASRQPGLLESRFGLKSKAGIQLAGLDTFDSALGEQSSQIEAFAETIAKKSKNIGEFKLTGGDTFIKFLSTVNKIPYARLEERYAALIKTTQELAGHQKALAQLEADQFKAEQELLRFTAALATATDAVDVLSSNTNFSSQSFSGIGQAQVQGFGNILSRPETADPAEFAQAIKSTSGLFGNGDLVSNRAIQAQKAQQNLPALLLKTATASTITQADPQQGLSAGLKDLGIDGDVRDIILNAANGLGNKVNDFFDKVTANPDKIAKQLTDSLTPFIKIFEEGDKAFTSSINKFLGHMNDAVQQTAKIDEEISKLSDIQGAGISQAAKFANGPTPVGQLQGLFKSNQERLSGNRGIGQDPSSLLEAIKANDNKISESRGNLQKLSRAPRNDDTVSKILKEQTALQGLTTSSVRLKTALDNLTNVSNTTAPAFERLGELERKRAQLFDVGQTIAFGGRQEKADLGKSIQLTLKAALQGHLGGFSDQDKQSVQGLLKSSPDIELAGIGKFQDLLQKLTKGELIRGGIAPDQADRLSNVAVGEEKSLQNDIIKAFDVAAEAQRANIDLLGKKQATFVDDTRKEFLGFVSALDTALSKNFQSGIESDISGKNTRLEFLGGQKKNLGELSGLVGASGEAGLTKARNIKNFIPKIDQLKAAAPLLRSGGTKGLAEELLAHSKGKTDVASISEAVTNSKILADSGTTLSKEQIQSIADLYEKTKVSGEFTGEYDYVGTQGGLSKIPRMRKLSDSEAFASSVESTFSKGTGSEPSARDSLSARSNASQNELAAANISQTDIDRTVGTQEVREKFTKLVASLESIESITKTNAEFANLNDSVSALTATMNTAKKQFEERALARSKGIVDATVGSFVTAQARASGGFMQPRGTDTVPAMLSPGEFVVNQASSRANAGLLGKINASKGPLRFASGGRVDFNSRLGAAVFAQRNASRNYDEGYAKGEKFFKEATRRAAAEANAPIPEKPATQPLLPAATKVNIPIPKTQSEQPIIGNSVSAMLDRPSGVNARVASQNTAQERRAARKLALDMRIQSEAEARAAKKKQTDAALAARLQSDAEARAAKKEQTDAALAARIQSDAEARAKRGVLPTQQIPVSAIVTSNARENSSPIAQARDAAREQKARAFNLGRTPLLSGKDRRAQIKSQREAALASRNTSRAFAAAGGIDPNTLTNINNFNSGRGPTSEPSTTPSSPTNPSQIATRPTGSPAAATHETAGVVNDGMTGLATALTTFNKSADALTSALEKFPKTIEISARHEVNVAFNGSEILATLEPKFKELVVGMTGDAIKKLVKEKFPDLLKDAS